MDVFKVILLLAMIAGLGAAQGGSPPLCLSNPPILLEAGLSTVEATVDNPFARRCEASLRFSDLSFLPIVWSFEPIACVGQEVASFVVPTGVPNGDAYLTWQCAGQVPTCNRAVIVGGEPNISLPVKAPGTVGCLSEGIHAHTTHITFTSSSRTVVETDVVISTFTTTNAINMPGFTPSSYFWTNTANGPSVSLTHFAKTTSSTGAVPDMSTFSWSKPLTSAPPGTSITSSSPLTIVPLRTSTTSGPLTGAPPDTSTSSSGPLIRVPPDASSGPFTGAPPGTSITSGPLTNVPPDISTSSGGSLISVSPGMSTTSSQFAGVPPGTSTTSGQIAGVPAGTPSTSGPFTGVPSGTSTIPLTTSQISIFPTAEPAVGIFSSSSPTLTPSVFAAAIVSTLITITSVVNAPCSTEST